MFPLLVCLVYATDASLVIKANPPDINMIDVQPLTINCTYQHDVNQTDQLLLNSILLSKIDGANSNGNSELSTLRASNPNAPTQPLSATNSATSSVKGQLSSAADGQSFLSITWTSPTEDQKGRYVCTAHAISSLGVSVYISNEVVVREDTFLVLRQKLKALEKEATHERECCRLVSSRLVEFEIWRKAMSTTMKYFGSELVFSRSSKGTNSTYFLSKYTVKDVDTAQTVCQTMGGYLAEIDDASEWTFVTNFLLNKKFTSVIIGGRDDVIEGVWYWMDSERPMTFTSWGKGEPNNSGNEDCLEIIHTTGTPAALAYNDYKCVAIKDRSQFLCEIPNDMPL